MTQKPSIDEVKRILVEMIALLDEDSLEYYIYGSLAYWLFVKEDSIIINNIDILIHEDKFSRLEEIITSSGLPYSLITTPHSIHVNHNEILGNDEKPFDISFDSIEHYLSPHGIELIESSSMTVNDVPIKLLPVNYLTKLYYLGVNGDDFEKRESYTLKLERLYRLLK